MDVFAFVEFLSVANSDYRLRHALHRMSGRPAGQAGTYVHRLFLYLSARPHL